MLNQSQKELPSGISELQDMVIDLHKKLEGIEQKLEGVERKLGDAEQKLEDSKQENERLLELLRLMRLKEFGRRSERFQEGMADIQRLLFAEMEVAEADEEEAEELEEIPIADQRRKKKSGRRSLPAHLPRHVVIHDIPEEEKICACGCRMTRIGKTTSERLQIIPAVLWVKKDIRYKYACKGCQGLESKGAVVKIAPLPVQMIPKSFASGSLLAHILIGKFCDALPFYRQEQQFKRYGVKISRATMCYWTIDLWKKFRLLLEMLRAGVQSDFLVNVDETPVQVLDEPERTPQNKSYIWAFRGGGTEKPVVYYQYDPSRSGEVPRRFLSGYRGYVQTDGYQAYSFIDKDKDMIHVGCWAHTRRKFFEVTQASDKGFAGRGKAKEALSIIRDLYRIERESENRGLDEEEVYKVRQERSKPIVEGFFQWAKETAPKVPPQSLLGKAFNYALTQRPRLERYLENGMLKMDNNIIENAIRPFVVGRKNWLFSQTPEGAQASAAFYSLIETAKANGLDPYKYLIYLFEKYPQAKSPDDIINLLPMYVIKSDIDAIDPKADLDKLSQPPPQQ